jgi:integrase
MARRALLPGESGPVRSSAEVRELSATDRYGKPTTRTETLWTARASRRAESSGLVERRSATGATKSLAEARLRAALHHDAKTALVARAAEATIDDFAQAWLKIKTVEAHLAPTTLSAYRATVDLHIVPALGGFRAEQLTARRAKEYLTELHMGSAEKPGSRANAKRARSILNGMLELAEEQGAVDHNVLAGIKLRLPQRKRTDARIVPADRVAEMFARADQHTFNSGRLGRYLRVQLGTGARIGEVLALRRSDYTPAADSRPARVLIDGTIIAPASGPVYRSSNPKTSTARRNVPITGYAAEALDQLVDDLDSRGLTGPGELLFQTVHGTPVAMGNLRRAWRSVRGDLPGLEELKPHALRATMASALVYSVGADKAARQLGHTGTGTIFAHYLHRRAFVDDVDLGAMELPQPTGQSSINP